MLKLGQRIYYGWLVLAAVSGINFANAATSIGVLTVFFLPLTEEFGWTRTQISAATSIGAVLGAVAAPFVGRLTDRFGARLPLTLGGLIIVLAALKLAAMTTLLWFFIAFSMARLADQAFVQAPSPPAVAKWFFRYRGRATAILFFLTSAGGVALPLMVQLVISLSSWRVAWVTLAGVVLVFGLVPCVLLVRRQPEDMGLSLDGDTSAENTTEQDVTEDEEQWRLGEALKTPTLWLLLISMFVLGLVSTGVALHTVPYLVERGISSTAAVGAVSISFVASAVGNLVWGYMAEKLSVRYLLFAAYLIRAASVGLLLVTDSLSEAYLFAILHGFTEGGLRTLTAIILAEYYGRRHLGSIYGLSRSVQVAGFALGPLVSGAAFDFTLTYVGAFASFLTYVGAFASFLVLGIIGSFLVAAAARPLKNSL